MGTIASYARWDLSNNCWISGVKYDIGRSFSIVNYNDFIRDNGGINYIIINHGSRVDNFSKDNRTISDSSAGINNILNHYKNVLGNYSIKLFLMDADAPIIENASFYARYIDYLADLPETESITIIGFSKCSVMNFYIPSFFTNPRSFELVNMFNVASPYNGTKLASPLIIYPEIKKAVYAKISDERLANLIYSKLIAFYESMSSNSHMDYDISVIGGIPKDKLGVYDETLIRDVFCKNNIEAINKLRSFRNIITGIDKNTLRYALRTMNFIGIGLCILDNVFFENKSDGMVYVDSQHLVEQHMDIKSDRLVSAHHDVCRNKKAIGDLLTIVDDTNKFMRIKK